MPKQKRWSELSPRNRRLVVSAGAVEGVLKIAALVDLWRRPPDQVRGSKVKWALALGLISSAGTLPVAYFLFGRVRPGHR